MTDDKKRSSFPRFTSTLSWLRWVGAGGMGEVYRARDTQLGREVAMAPRRTSADRSRLGDHNQAAARLNIHPNSLRRLIRSLHLRDTLGSDPSRDR